MTEHKKTIQQYLIGLKNIIDAFPVRELEKIVSLLEDARDREATVFICGNGGSWATAAHMVCDFNKNTRMPENKRMRVIGLGDNIPSLTAYANDEGYDRVFSEPLFNLFKPNDILIAFSGSGNSPNVLRAVEVANQLDGITIGLTGFKGGKLIKSVDHCLVIHSDSMEMIEDFHMIVDHLLTICLRNSKL